MSRICTNVPGGRPGRPCRSIVPVSAAPLPSWWSSPRSGGAWVAFTAAVVACRSCWPTWLSRYERSAMNVTTSAITRPAARRATRAMVRRPRNDMSVVVEPERVPGSPDGADQRRPVAVELAAQVAHQRLHDIRVRLGVVGPHRRQDLRLGEDAAGVEQEVPQQVELSGRQVDRLAGPEHLVVLGVELEVAEPEDAVAVTEAGAAEDRPDAGDDLAQAERLGQVVVGPGGEAEDLVLGGVAGRQEQHGHGHPLAAQPAGELEAVDVGQHDVEHDEIGAEPLDLVE